MNCHPLAMRCQCSKGKALHIIKEEMISGKLDFNNMKSLTIMKSKMRIRRTRRMIIVVILVRVRQKINQMVIVKVLKLHIEVQL